MSTNYFFVLNAAVITTLVGWLIRKLQGIAAYISERMREKEKKHIDEKYDKLIQECCDKIVAIQPVIEKCEQLLTRTDRYTGTQEP